MFDYRPLARMMKEKGKNTEDIARLLGMTLEEVKDKLNNNRFISMSQLNKLCGFLECGPGEVLHWSPDGDVVEVNWDKVASFGRPITTLSIECGLSRAALINARNGTGNTKRETVEKLAEVLDCSVEELIKGE